MKLAALPLIALVLASCSTQVSVTRLENINQDLVPQTKSLRLINHNGDITVSAVTAHNNINIDADFFANANSEEAAQQMLEQLQITTSYSSGGMVVIEVTGPTNNCGADLSLQIPEGFNVDIRNSNGDIDVVPLVNAVSLRTVNGNIVLKSNSKVRAKTTNGNVIYQGNSLDFDLRTVNGNVNVTQSALFDGSGSLTTTNGSLRINNSATIDAKVVGDTVHGDYMIYGPKLFEDQGSGLIRVSTVNGNINITHAETPATVE
ncbi:MAG: hypothetical protein H8E25_12880 [Planctomycetes bacterium]|nr:hypothetical protein [Planctomycetota bacterium]